MVLLLDVLGEARGGATGDLAFPSCTGSGRIFSDTVIVEGGPIGYTQPALLLGIHNRNTAGSLASLPWLICGLIFIILLSQNPYLDQQGGD